MHEFKLILDTVHIIYFFIGFILYTLLDLAWCKFIFGIKENNPKMAGLSSLAITFIVFIVSWIMYVEKSLNGLFGAAIGSFFGSYIGCIIVNNKKEK